MILTMWLYGYNMQFIKNGLEEDADFDDEEYEMEDTDGVEVEHLHISDYQGFALIYIRLIYYSDETTKQVIDV